jgi:hypothetical protein
VEFGSLSTALGIFDKKIEESNEKTTKLGRVLKANSVDTHDNQKALEGMFTILSKLPDGATQTRLAIEAFGRSGKEMLGLVKEAHGDLPALIRRLDEMGATISDKDARAAHEFNEKLELLKKQFDAAKVKVGQELLPVFEKLFDDLSSWLANNEGELRSWGETFAATARTIINWAGAIKSAFNSIQSITPGSAADDPHQGGPSYAGQLWEWVTGPSADQAKIDAAFGKGPPPHMATPAEIEAQGRAARQAQEAAQADARRRQALEAATTRQLGAGGGGKKGGSGAGKEARAELKELEDNIRDESERHTQFNEELRRAYERRIYDLNKYVKDTKDELDKHFNAVSDEYDKEEELIKETVKGRAQQHEKLADLDRKRNQALRQYEKDRTAIEDEAADKRHAATEARKDALLNVAEESARSRINAVQRAVSLETKKESDAAREIGDIQLDLQRKQAARIQDRLRQAEVGSAEYKRIQGEYAAAEIAYAETVAATAAQVAEALKKEADARRELIEQERIYSIEVRRQEIEVAAGSTRFPSRRERLSVLRQLAQQETDLENEQHNQKKEQLERDRQIAEQKLEDTKVYDRLLEDETRRHNAAMKDINNKEKQGERAEDPFGGIKDEFEKWKVGIENTSESVRNSVGKLATDVFHIASDMTAALGQGIEANILYGESIGLAMKKALAAELAHVSAEAWIESLRHAAWAVGSLAFGNFAAAAKHAEAAAGFAALALIAGKAGGALAQSAGLRGSSTASGSAVAASANPTPNNQSFNYGGQLSTPSSSDLAGGSRYQGRPGPGAAIAAVLNGLNAQLSRIQGIPPGQMVALGAPAASGEISAAVLQHTGENHEFTANLNYRLNAGRV